MGYNELVNFDTELIDDSKLDEIPIFINSQFYELIEVLHSAPYQINGF